MARLYGLLTLLSLLVCAASGQSNSTQSGCEICATIGDCSRAYRGAEGQFCGNWLDRQNERRPCCCPDNAVCKVSNYACNCGYAAPPPYRDGRADLLWLWWFLGSLALLLCCCGCCCMAVRKIRARDYNSIYDDPIPVATPVPGQVAGESSNQPYSTSSAYANAPPAAAATPAYGRYYGQSRGGGGMGAGTGAALGGTAGLLGGLLLGETLADHGADGGGGGDFGGGGADFGGGGDFGGDF